jgi:hypothetical protein
MSSGGIVADKLMQEIGNYINAKFQRVYIHAKFGSYESQ